MEVEVLGVDGAPDGAVVSIRAGSQRKQAAVSALGSSANPFRFGVGANGVNPFRIDLMQPAGSVKMALRPGEGNYSADLKAIGKGGKDVKVRFAVREAGKKVQTSPAKLVEKEKPVGKSVEDSDDPLQAAAAIAKEYLDSHQLLPFVRALIQTVIRERPKDPYDFIANQFRAASAAGGGAGAAPDASLEASEADLKASKAAAPDPPETAEPTKQAPPQPAAVEEAAPGPAAPEEAAPEGEALCPEEQLVSDTNAQSCKQAPPPSCPPPAAEATLETPAEKVSLLTKKATPEQEPAAKFNRGAQEVEAAVCRPAPVRADLRPVAPFAFLPSAGTWLAPRPLPRAGARVPRPALEARVSFLMLPTPGPPCAVASGRNKEKAEGEPMTAAADALPSDPAEELKAKARAAMACIFSSDPRDATPCEVRAAKAKARDALERALVELGSDSDIEEDQPSGDLVGRARVALQALLLQQEADPEDEAAKEKARSALEAALCEDEGEQQAKLQAQTALEAALDEDQPAKLQAQAALEAALVSEAGAKAPPPAEEGEEGDDEGLEAAKLEARGALDAALADCADEARLKAEAQEVLQAILLPEEDEDTKERARSVLEASLASTEGTKAPPPAEEEDLEAAKLEAQAVLDSVLGESEDEDRLKAEAQEVLESMLGAWGLEADMDTAKLEAQAVLDKALSGDVAAETQEDGELEAAKLEAQAELDRVLSGDVVAEAEESDLKANAREALQNALLPQDSELDAAKEEARSVLENVLPQDAAPSKPLNRQRSRAEMKMLKETARSALASALLGGGDAEDEEGDLSPEELEQARGRAREALRLALLSQGRSRSEVPAAPLSSEVPAAPLSPEGVRDAKEKARMALEAQFLGVGEEAAGADAAGEEPPPLPEGGEAAAEAGPAGEVPEDAVPEVPEPEPVAAPAPEVVVGGDAQEPLDRETEAAQAVQARLGVAKERMSNANNALKDEVRRLNTSYTALVQQRDALKSKIGQA